MSYIGQTLPADSFQGFTTDSFTGDGSATTFTLSKTPFNESALLVVINNVVQKPTTNFTVSGTTLTIVGTAVASGDVIYATHIGGALPIGQAASLDLNGASDQLILDADGDTTISADTDDQIDIKIGGADDFAFKANNFEVQSGSTIDMNGQELILDADGDTSITADTDDQIDFKCAGLDTIQMNKYGQIKHTRDSATTFGGSTSFIHQRGTIASPSIVNSGDTIGLLQSAAYDGTAYLDGPRILFQVDGTPGDDDMPTRIVFQTTADGTAGTLGEVMRLRNDTDVVTCDITSSATTDTTAVLSLLKPDETHSSSTRMIGFDVGSQGRGFILNGTSDSGSPSFGAGSDRRLKKNITAYTGGYDKIKSIPVQTWDEQFTDATGVKGWIADELDDVFPDAVTGTKDATKTVTNAIISEHGNSLKEGITEEEFNELKEKGRYANCTWSASKVVPSFQMSAPLKFFPDVVQALQAAITKIETLETKVKALEDA
jgi:hypothetical protein